MIIGGAVISNGNRTCELFIDNKVPILRQKDIMKEEQADSPCRRIYFVIQLMYIDQENIEKYHKIYWELVQQIINAAPNTLGLIDEISEFILNNQFYQALKHTNKLIRYEQEVISHVCKAV